MSRLEKAINCMTKTGVAIIKCRKSEKAGIKYALIQKDITFKEFQDGFIICSSKNIILRLRR